VSAPDFAAIADDRSTIAAGILAAKVPAACQTCDGTGQTDPVCESCGCLAPGEPTCANCGGFRTMCRFDCPDCPTIGSLLAYGFNVATAAPAEPASSSEYSSAAAWGFNECLDALRAIEVTP